MELTLALDPHSRDYEAKIEFSVSKEQLHERILSNIVAMQQDEHFRMVGDTILMDASMQEACQSHIKNDFFKHSEDKFIQANIIQASSSDGPMPFVVSPPMSLDDIIRLITSAADRLPIGSQSSGDGPMPFAGDISKTVPVENVIQADPVPTIKYARHSSLPVVYVAPGLAKNFKYHPNRNCRTLHGPHMSCPLEVSIEELPLGTARCKVCG
jgi:hypothetical protein